MQHGSKMIKLDVSRKGHQKKTFILDADMTRIRYEPSKKNSRCKLIKFSDLFMNSRVVDVFKRKQLPNLLTFFRYFTI